jgi:diguanylate cyclase (GGDEF)-like protein
MFERNRRCDHTKEAFLERCHEALAPTSGQAGWAARLRHWNGIAGQWVSARARGWTGGISMSREEEILHGMGAALEHAEAPDEVERILIESVRNLTGARSIRWSADERHLEPLDGGIWVVIASGGIPRRQLFVSVPLSGEPSWPAPTLHRLRTLCTMASHALSRIVVEVPREVDQGSIPCACLPDAETGPRAKAGGPEKGFKEHHHVAPVFQDATFLNALLPYAFGQARRHGEPLSILCAEVDRLGGIRDLLGGDQADRAVRNVGDHIASMIRDSDIVARLEDDRIIVLLPKAWIQDGLRVAQDICQSVEKQTNLFPDLPGLTVSIGVAEYPSCAGTIYALLDAVDIALSDAKCRGRNRAVAAKSLSIDNPSAVPRLVG